MIDLYFNDGAIVVHSDPPPIDRQVNRIDLVVLLIPYSLAPATDLITGVTLFSAYQKRGFGAMGNAMTMKTRDILLDAAVR